MCCKYSCIIQNVNFHLTHVDLCIDECLNLRGKRECYFKNCLAVAYIYRSIKNLLLEIIFLRIYIYFFYCNLYFLISTKSFFIKYFCKLFMCIYKYEYNTIDVYSMFGLTLKLVPYFFKIFLRKLIFLKISERNMYLMFNPFIFVSAWLIKQTFVSSLYRSILWNNKDKEKNFKNDEN